MFLVFSHLYAFSVLILVDFGSKLGNKEINPFIMVLRRFGIKKNGFLVLISGFDPFTLKWVIL